jgi:hypothetical protein
MAEMQIFPLQCNMHGRESFLHLHILDRNQLTLKYKKMVSQNDEVNLPRDQLF